MERKIIKDLLVWKNKKNKKPLIINGARQVGKTYILKEFAKYFTGFHYINFELDIKFSHFFDTDLDPKRIINELSLYLNKEIKITDLIIFDEIQNSPKAINSLKYFAEEEKSFNICAAGSLLGINLGTESFPVGKVEFLNMYPMDFLEFLKGVREKKLFNFLNTFNIEKDFIPDPVHQKLWNLLKIYFVTGGLPEVVFEFSKYKDNLFVAFSKVKELQKNLIISYIADMAKHSGKINSMHIQDVWVNIARQTTKEQDASIPKFLFNSSDKIERFSTLKGPIAWLNKAGLIFQIPIVNTAKLPLSAFTKDNLFKLAIFDLGILGTIVGLSANTIMEYDYGTYKGYFA